MTENGNMVLRFPFTGSRWEIPIQEGDEFPARDILGGIIGQCRVEYIHCENGEAVITVKALDPEAFRKRLDNVEVMQSVTFPSTN